MLDSVPEQKADSFTVIVEGDRGDFQTEKPLFDFLGGDLMHEPITEGPAKSLVASAQVSLMNRRFVSALLHGEVFVHQRSDGDALLGGLQMLDEISHRVVDRFIVGLE